MLGLGLGITRLGGVLLPKWLRAFFKRVREDGGTVEGKKCVQTDGEFLINNTRAGIIVDYLGAYAITQGGDGLESRECSAQAVNDLLYDPKPQAKFMFLAQDEGLALENYYCLSNDVDALEGDLAVFGEVTHTYGSDSSAGAIALSVENGTAPYTYRWSNGATVEDITGLTKGVYNIQVTDSLGAIANNSFTVRGDADASIVTAGLRMNNVFGPNALTFPASGSAEFNGTSDYVEVLSDGKNSAFDTQTFTISAWVNVKPNGDNVIWSYDFTSHGAQPYYAQQFRLLGGGNVYFGWNNNGALQDMQSGGGFYSANDWVHIAVTFRNKSQKMYIDGSQVRSESSTATITYYNQEVWIGKANFGGEFDGNMANVAFWNRVLHPDEINSIMWKSYSDLNAVDKNGLQAWYALDDITGTTVPDSTGNHNGTAN